MADEETLSRVANIVDGHEWSRFGGSVGEQVAAKLDEAGLLAGDSALRERLTALADEIERGDLAYPTGGGEGHAASWAFARAADRLRALAASPAVDATPEPTPAYEPQHIARRVKMVDGWIQVVECSCSDTKWPTTHEWARNHFGGSFEDGWKVLEDLVKTQKRPTPASPAPVADPSGGDHG